MKAYSLGTSGCCPHELSADTGSGGEENKKVAATTMVNKQQLTL